MDVSHTTLNDLAKTTIFMARKLLNSFNSFSPIRLAEKLSFEFSELLLHQNHMTCVQNIMLLDVTN